MIPPIPPSALATPTDLPAVAERPGGISGFDLPALPGQGSLTESLWNASPDDHPTEIPEEPLELFRDAPTEISAPALAGTLPVNDTANAGQPPPAQGLEGLFDALDLAPPGTSPSASPLPSGLTPQQQPSQAPHQSLRPEALGPASAFADLPSPSFAHRSTSQASATAQQAPSPQIGASASPQSLGFSLALEDAEEDTDETTEANLGQTATTVRPPSALPAIEVQNANLSGAGVQLLAPHKSAKAEAAAGHSPNRKRKIAATVAFTGALAAGLAAIFLVSGDDSETSAYVGAEKILAPHKPSLDRDLFPAYRNAAQALKQAAALNPPDVDSLRVRAAIILAEGHLIHKGPQEMIDEARGLMAQVSKTTVQQNLLQNVSALLAIAKGRTAQVPTLIETLGENNVAGRLVSGLFHLREGRGKQAAAALKRLIEKQPRQARISFLLGQALESSGDSQGAAEAFDKTLKLNPDHLGAALARIRVADESAQSKLERATKLLEGNSNFVALAAPAEVSAVHAFRGQQAQMLGLTAKAERALTAALAVDPNNSDTNLAFAAYLLSRGRYEEAHARYQAAGPQALQKADGAFGMAGALIATGQADLGLKRLSSAARSWPEDPRGAFFKGWALERGAQPNLEKALTLYRAALLLDPAFTPATLQLASALQRQGQAEEALAALQSAQEAGASPAALRMAYGEALINAQQPLRAEALFRQAIGSNPDNLEAHFGLAEAMAAHGRVGEAKEHLESLLKRLPDAKGVRDRIARFALRLGLKQEAIALYKREIESGHATPQVRVALGKVALKTGALELAFEHLQFVAQNAPSTPGALYLLGQLHERQGGLAKALQEYKRATQFENTPPVQLAYGKALLKGGREDEGLVALRRAESLPLARLELGRALLRRGEFNRAIVDLQMAVTLDTQLAEAHLLMGNAHDSIGKTSEAAEAWQAAIAIEPENTEALYRLGRLEMDRGQPRNALLFLRRAAKGVGTQKAWAPEVFFQLGYAELRSGSKKRARAALERYLSLAPKDTPARPAVERELQRLPS